MGNSAHIDVKFEREITFDMIKEVVEILNSFGIYFYKYIKEKNKSVAQKKAATWVFNDISDDKNESEQIINGDPATCMKKISEKGGYIPMQSTDNRIDVELEYYPDFKRKIISLRIPTNSTRMDLKKIEILKTIAEEIRNKFNGTSIQGHDEYGVKHLNFKL